jgi:hypothetical protein
MINDYCISSDNRQVSTRCSSLWQRLEKPLTGLTFTIALILLNGGFHSLKAQGAEVPESIAQHSSGEVAAAPVSQSSQVALNGIYLYGQAPNVEQLGSTYVVFEVDRYQQVTGAFYMPQSSFDCFQGELQANQLAVTITDSYDRTTYSYTVALEQEAAVADRDGRAIAPINLIGFHAIETVGTNDQNVLATCKAMYQ